jgi:predicted nucleic acid-binding protein
MKYSLDTSALIDGFEDYPPEVFRTLWQRMHYLSLSGSLIASEEVLSDLQKKDDGSPYQWLRARPHMIVPVDEAIQLRMKDIMRSHPRLVNTQKGRSASDPWVIALAVVTNGAVVSSEKHRTNNHKRPKIPDVCEDLGILHLRIADVFRRQGWDF